MSETTIKREILTVIGSKPCIRLFNNATGFDPVRKVHYGLCVGSSDLIGFKSRIVSQDMVGKKIAQFVAIEVKTEKGQWKKRQKEFLDMVTNMGGLAGRARSVKEAEEICIN